MVLVNGGLSGPLPPLAGAGVRRAPPLRSGSAPGSSKPTKSLKPHIADLAQQLNASRTGMEVAGRLVRHASASTQQQQQSPPQEQAATRKVALSELSGEQLARATGDAVALEKEQTRCADVQMASEDDDMGEEDGEGAAFTLEQLANAAAAE